MNSNPTIAPPPNPRRVPGPGSSWQQDLALIDALKAGDAGALDDLMRKYRSNVVRQCMRVVQDEHVSEDLAQEVFLRVYLNVHKYNPDYAFYGWLSRIATNCCIDYLRYRQARPEDASLAWERASEPMPYGRRRRRPPADGYTTLADKQLRHVVREAIDALPRRLREVIVLRELEGHSYKQIGEITACTSSAVKSRLFQARLRLRELLERDYRTVLGG